MLPACLYHSIWEARLSEVAGTASSHSASTFAQAPLTSTSGPSSHSQPHSHSHSQSRSKHQCHTRQPSGGASSSGRGGVGGGGGGYDDVWCASDGEEEEYTLIGQPLGAGAGVWQSGCEVVYLGCVQAQDAYTCCWLQQQLGSTPRA